MEASGIARRPSRVILVISIEEWIGISAIHAPL